MRGVVTCVHPRAAQEGAQVLEAGGNAFDAAVATAFVQMILNPFSCGLGGMVSAHLWAPAKGEHRVIDGCVRAGSRVREGMWARDYRGEAAFSGSSLFHDHRSTMGYTSICTPAAVSALAQVQRRYCTMSWPDLLGPAVGIARKGFPVTPQLAKLFSTARGKSRHGIRPGLHPGGLCCDSGTYSRYAPESRLVRRAQPRSRCTRDFYHGLSSPGEPVEPDALDRIRSNSECSRIYLHPGGSPFREGEILSNPDYAATLERLATHGPEDFYRGELGREIWRDLEANGAYVTRRDLESYRPRSYPPRSSRYRSFEIFSNDPPGAGFLLQEALNVLEGLDLSRLEHGGLRYLSYLASTLQLVDVDRRDYLGDPEVVGEEPGQVLISRHRARELRNAVLEGAVGTTDPDHQARDTTHLNVVDRDGNVAAITHSLGGFSGIITPGLGFIYNNAMNRYDPRPGQASSLAPGKARMHLMMPAIAFQEGQVAMVLGAPGGNAILSALAQVFINVVEFGMGAVEAVSAPRIHAEGRTVWCEGRTPVETCDGLRRRGFNVVRDPAPLARRLGLAQLVVAGPEGRLEGGSDPRGESGVAYARA